VSWNYRIIRRTFKGHASYQIREVYYRPDETIEGWTENPINPAGETPEELKQDFSRQLLAFESPILDYEQLSQGLYEKR
jgi:hypothetical protein